MTSSRLIVRLQPPSGIILIDRPAKRNALSRALIGELGQALDDLYRERKVRAVVLGGTGPAFCAGLDLDEMLQTTRSDDPYPQWQADVVGFRDLLQTMLRFPKPLIAAVHGPAIGGGAGLLLAADIVVAAADAQFGLPEPRRGLAAGIVTPLLAFRIGAGHAANLLLTARTIAADEAHRIGLFHEVVPADRLWSRVAEITAECAGSASEALALTKRMLYETVGEHLGTLLSAGAAISASARTTEAAAEGIAAFLQRRPPQWP